MDLWMYTSEQFQFLSFFNLFLDIIEMKIEESWCQRCWIKLSLDFSPDIESQSVSTGQPCIALLKAPLLAFHQFSDLTSYILSLTFLHFLDKEINAKVSSKRDALTPRYVH